MIKVPVGTQVLADDEEAAARRPDRVGQRIILLKGGIGGRGNASYKTSTNRAPRQHGTGMPGEEMWVWLRLKLLADVGLVGLPNAGKSTFLNSVSNAAAKVGDYPFTTLRPQLGVVRHKGREFVLADIPGLIEGAAEGAGIGDRFLGHVERTRLLLHLVDASARTRSRPGASSAASSKAMAPASTTSPRSSRSPRPTSSTTRSAPRLVGSARGGVRGARFSPSRRRSTKAWSRLLDAIIQPLGSAGREGRRGGAKGRWTPL